VGNEGRWVSAAGGMGGGDGLHCMGPGARRDWCVTERGYQWGIVVTGGARSSLMRNGSGGFQPWRCGEGEFNCRLHDG
jgi:hypothetical protein